MFWIFFLVSKKIGFLGILGPPFCGIRATIRIGQEMLCLMYAGFLLDSRGTLFGGQKKTYTKKLDDQCSLPKNCIQAEYIKHAILQS